MIEILRVEQRDVIRVSDDDLLLREDRRQHPRQRIGAMMPVIPEHEHANGRRCLGRPNKLWTSRRDDHKPAHPSGPGT